MAQLIVRNIPEDVKRRLKLRARRRGRSLEAEVRDILDKASCETGERERDGEAFATRLAGTMRKLGIEGADLDELEQHVAEGRRKWRARDIGLGS